MKNKTLLDKMRASRNAAAHDLGLGLDTLLRYEHGRVSMPLETAEAMAEMYGVTFDEFRKAARMVREDWLSRHTE